MQEKLLNTIIVQLQEVVQKVNILESKVDSLDSKVDSLDSKVDSLDSKVNSLDSKVDENQKEMNKRFEEINARFDKNEKEINVRFDNNIKETASVIRELSESISRKMHDQHNELLKEIRKLEKSNNRDHKKYETQIEILQLETRYLSNKEKLA